MTEKSSKALQDKEKELQKALKDAKVQFCCISVDACIIASMQFDKHTGHIDMHSK